MNERRSDSGDNLGSRTVLTLAALVLAGGRATRVGGGDKPLLPVGGRPMLTQILEDLQTQRCARIVVVGPARLPVPPGVELTLENPPFGGPVAGIIAGLRHLADSLGASPEIATDSEKPGTSKDLICGNEGSGTDQASPTVPDFVAILAGDSPAGARLVPALVSGLSGADASFDGCVATSETQKQPYLCGVYRFQALAARAGELGADTGEGRDMSVRRFFQPLQLVKIPDCGNLSRDFDTWEDINAHQNKI